MTERSLIRGGQRSARPRFGLALSTGAVAVGIGLLLCGCSRVNVTPLGSTHGGRPQFEITCNKRATDSGSCNEKALDVCVGGYETMDIGYTMPTPVSNNGQLSLATADRVLLIACN